MPLPPHPAPLERCVIISVRILGISSRSDKSKKSVGSVIFSSRGTSSVTKKACRGLGVMGHGSGSYCGRIEWYSGRMKCYTISFSETVHVNWY